MDRRTWIVVADASRARVFAGASLTPALPYDLVASRQSIGERVTDRGGQTHERVGRGGHTKCKSVDARAQADRVLAASVAEAIRHGRVEQRFDSIVLVAAPAFLGLLRQALDGPSRALVVASFAKDLSKVPEHDLRRRLRELLGGATANLTARPPRLVR